MYATGSLLLFPGCDGDLAAFLQFVDAGHHDFVARRETRSDFGLIAFSGADGDLSQRDSVVRLDEPDVRGCGVALNGGGRQQRDAGLFLLEQARVDELLRDERVVGVVEKCAQFQRAGGGIDLVIDGRERAGCDLILEFAIPCIDGKFLAGADFL